jgi:acetoin utilization protein AcuB
MTAEELIQASVPFLKKEDKVEHVLELMEDFGFELLPVVESNIFRGFLTEDTLDSLLNQDVDISNLKYEYQEAFVGREQHIYDVLRIAFQNDAAFVAVLNEKKEYLGTIVVAETMSYFASMNAFNSPGGILVLAMAEAKYSLGEISRIIESNGAKVLSSGVMQDPESVGNIKLVLKLNQPDLSRVIAALERFQYSIIGQYHDSDFEDVDKKRLDNLFRYLNI